MCEQRAQFRIGQTTFAATIMHQHATKTNEFWVKFQSRRKEDAYVDLELNLRVSSGGCSWWRLDGYDTNEEDEEDESESEEDDEPNQPDQPAEVISNTQSMDCEPEDI